MATVLEKRLPKQGEVIIDEQYNSFLVLGYSKLNLIVLLGVGTVAHDGATILDLELECDYITRLVTGLISAKLEHLNLIRERRTIIRKLNKTDIQGEVYEARGIIPGYAYPDMSKLSKWYTKNALIVGHMPAIHSFDELVEGERKDRAKKNSDSRKAKKSGEYVNVDNIKVGYVYATPKRNNYMLYLGKSKSAGNIFVYLDTYDVKHINELIQGAEASIGFYTKYRKFKGIPTLCNKNELVGDLPLDKIDEDTRTKLTNICTEFKLPYITDGKKVFSSGCIYRGLRKDSNYFCLGMMDDGSYLFFPLSDDDYNDLVHSKKPKLYVYLRTLDEIRDKSLSLIDDHGYTLDDFDNTTKYSLSEYSKHYKYEII